MIPKPLDAIAPDLFSSYGFQQLIDIPTRTTDATLSLIDLFDLNNPDNSLPRNVQASNLTDYKMYNSKEIKPPQFKHFSKGNKLSNSFLNRIRVGRSFLNQHTFSIRHADSPQCLCYFREESPSHYFLDCFLYSPERQALFNLFEHYILKFPNFSKHKKL